MTRTNGKQTTATIDNPIQTLARNQARLEELYQRMLAATEQMQESLNHANALLVELTSKANSYDTTIEGLKHETAQRRHDMTEAFATIAELQTRMHQINRAFRPKQD